MGSTQPQLTSDSSIGKERVGLSSEYTSVNSKSMIIVAQWYY